MTTSRDRERARQERIKNDPEYRAEYLSRKRREAKAHGPYPKQMVPGYEGSRKSKWREANPDADKRLRLAHWTVDNALRRGDLKRPDACQSCGVACKTEAHHRSYAKEDWLNVEWLCSLCHGKADAERRSEVAMRIQEHKE